MKKERFYVLDYLRVIAVWGVMFYHTNQIFPVSSFFVFGSTGIQVTVVLTGLLCGYLHGNDYDSYSLKDSVQVWRKKILKFYPVHFLCFLAAIPLHFFSRNLLHLSLSNLLYEIGVAIPNLLLLQSLCPMKIVYYGFNGVSWYLSMTMVLYFLSPLIIHRLSKWKMLEQRIAASFALAGCVYLAISLLCCTPLKQDFDYALFAFYINPFIHIAGFTMAITVGMCLSEKVEMKKTMLSKPVLLGVLFLCLCSYICKKSIEYNAVPVTVNQIQLELLDVVACLAIIRVFPNKRNTVLEFLAESSFSLYMVHQVVVRYSGISIHLTKYPIAGFIVSFVVSVVLSILLYKMTNLFQSQWKYRRKNE